MFDYLRNCVDGGHVESVRGMRLLQDGSGAVFDVPKEYAKEFVEKCASSSPCTFQRHPLDTHVRVYVPPCYCYALYSI